MSDTVAQNTNKLLWYPDNVNRRDRATQLSNDTSELQNNVTEAEENILKHDKRTILLINDILKQNKHMTFDQLKQKVMDALSPADADKYKKLIAMWASEDMKFDDSLIITSSIAFFAGISTKLIDIGLLIRAGILISTARQYARVFYVAITEGIGAANKFLKEVRISAKLAIEAIGEESKIAKFASKIGRVLEIFSVFGIIADAFLLALSAYEEHEQKVQLINAIHELSIQRLIAKFYYQMIDAINTWKAETYDVLVLMNDDGTVDPEMEPGIKKLGKAFIKNVEADWSDVTSDSCYGLLAKLDSNRHSWRNEDPSKDWVISQADLQKK
jgi:hypothetical protein